ncbi:MAG TPA: tRNA (guanosine(46)-N7)-methyltransferase TrmB [Oscillospiraceae bacterium]|nr:tRNA (guanosine(46)-N7)-methyltransferase TrmB [Oscillospiraceae bacterium]
MRPKQKKNAKQRLIACADVIIDDINAFKDGFFPVFNNHNPVHLEIGCGKGGFVCGTAKLYPNINFIAVERVETILISAAENVKNSGLSNVRVCPFNANMLYDIIPKNTIERIYLNFSDPWHKTAHQKRRLTHKNFLEIYKKLLVSGGSIFMKTDNDGLFDFSITQLEDNGFELKNISYDLSSNAPKDNIVTEYEKRFTSLGIKIKRLEAYKK